jgi:hypothetical protein
VTWQLVRVQAVAGLADGGSRRQWRRSRIRPAAAACSGVASSRGWWRITGKGGSRGEIQ